MEAKETRFRCLGCGQLVTPTQNHPIECCESFKAGIKEVVDWIKEQERKTIFDIVVWEVLDEVEWNAKLKEWGISEPEIDEAQELADLRHNASDDTIG